MLILNGNTLKIKLRISFHLLKERLFIIKENLMLSLSLMLKASLRFTRFTVRGLPKVNRQMALVIMAWNMKKLTNKIGQFCEYQFRLKEKIAKSNLKKLNFAIFITEAVY